jgi:hypothetical protein
MAQVNSLKKLAADLNTVHQKTLKGDNNILNPLKKPSSDGKKLGLEAGINNKEGVTSSWLSAFCNFVNESKGPTPSPPAAAAGAKCIATSVPSVVTTAGLPATN